MATSVRRLVMGTVATMLATVGLQTLDTGSAFAHSNAVTGQASCQKAGTYSVTWTVQNDYDQAETVTVTDHTPAAASMDPTSFPLDNLASTTVTETDVEGSAIAATLKVKGVFTDGTVVDSEGSVTLAGTCDTPTTTSVTPVAPKVHQATCYAGKPTAPQLALATTSGIAYSVSSAGPYTNGDTVTVTATADSGNVFAQPAPSGWTDVDTTHETYNVAFDTITCGGTAIPEAPVLTQAQCQGGSPTTPTLALGSTNGITYSVVPTAPYRAGQTVKVTAIADGGGSFVQPAPTGWTFVSAARETYTLTFDTVTCTDTVTPEKPTVAQAQCQGGVLSAPTLTVATTSGITYVVAPSAPYTAGQSVIVRAIATSGHQFEAPAPSGWTFSDTRHEAYAVTFDSVDCATTTPTPPTFQANECANGTPAGATYTIVATKGVIYFVNGVRTPAGTYPVADGASVTITTAPQAGYTLTGTMSFAHTYPAAPDCSTKTTPTTPGFSNDQCVNFQPTGATYTIIRTPGVDYYVNDVRTPAGTYPATDATTVMITTQARPGYTLTGTQTFEHTFPVTPTCTTTAETVAPGFDNSQCASGAPTQSNYTLSQVIGVAYTVNGSVTPAGTYPATDGTTVSVEAAPLPGYTLTGSTEFTHTYPEMPTCAASVVAAPASFIDDVCVSDQLTGASFTVPPTTGVTYSVEGTEIDAGTYPATDGSTLSVVASAQAGFTLTGITQWTHIFPAKPTNCLGAGSANGSRPPSTTGTNLGTLPISTNRAPAATGVPVASILLTGIGLLLLGTACFVAATSRRRGLPAN